MLRHVLLATTLLGTVATSFAATGRQIRVESSISVLGDITFVDHSATLTDEARRSLADVARTLAGNPTLHIEVESPLVPGLTPTIAERRADAVRTFLDTHGVAGSRLATRVVPSGAGIQLILE